MRLPRISHRLAVFLPLTAALTYGLLSARPAGRPAETAVIGKLKEGIYLVPTGQALTPAGQNFPFDGRPVDTALSPDGKTLAVMLGSDVRLFDTAANRFRA